MFGLISQVLIAKKDLCMNASIRVKYLVLNLTHNNRFLLSNFKENVFALQKTEAQLWTGWLCMVYNNVLIIKVYSRKGHFIREKIAWLMTLLVRMVHKQKPKKVWGHKKLSSWVILHVSLSIGPPFSRLALSVCLDFETKKSLRKLHIEGLSDGSQKKSFFLFFLSPFPGRSSCV